MQNNMIDFIRETALYMATDRPDVYDAATAVDDLVTMMDTMRERGESTWTAFASFLLFLHYEDDGVEEWNLTRKISSATIFHDEGEVLVLGYTKDSGTLKYGVELTDVTDQDLDL